MEARDGSEYEPDGAEETKVEPDMVYVGWLDATPESWHHDDFVNDPRMESLQEVFGRLALKNVDDQKIAIVKGMMIADEEELEEGAEDVLQDLYLRARISALEDVLEAIIG